MSIKICQVRVWDTLTYCSILSNILYYYTIMNVAIQVFLAQQEMG